MTCPLCIGHEEPKIVKGPFDQNLLLCSNCYLVFRSRGDLVKKDEERARYLTHNNSRQDEGYVKFLLKAYTITQSYLRKDQRMLDFGCGYNPVFAQLMREKGFQCDHYDPFFFEEGIRQPKYPVIFCIETAEHFHYPLEDWEHLDQLLDENGILTVMTEMWSNEADFPDWHYMKDETHTSFYHVKTLNWIARELNWKIVASDKERITVFKK